MSYILYIDTSGTDSIFFLSQDAKIIATRTSTLQTNHSHLIHIHLNELLLEAGINWNQIHAIAIQNGPGSYTGLRISLSTAKGICYVHSIPLFLFHHFEIIHYCIPSKNRSMGILLFARENEFFFSAYNSLEEIIQEPSLILRSDLDSFIEEKNVDLVTVDSKLKAYFPKIEEIELTPEKIASYIFKEISSKKEADLFYSEPFYLKNVYINK